MALHRQRGIVQRHAAAVIAHLDALLAAVLQQDIDRHRLRVDGVLDQLFDHRRGALDDFTGGDLIDEIGGKNVDTSHRGNYKVAGLLG